jgi:hypothetical protein
MNITLDAYDGLIIFGPFLLMVFLMLIGFGVQHYKDNF